MSSRIWRVTRPRSMARLPTTKSIVRKLVVIFTVIAIVSVYILTLVVMMSRVYEEYDRYYSSEAALDESLEREFADQLLRRVGDRHHRRRDFSTGRTVQIIEQFSLTPDFEPSLWNAFMVFHGAFRGEADGDGGDGRRGDPPFQLQTKEEWQRFLGGSTQSGCRASFLSCFEPPDTIFWDENERFFRLNTTKAYYDTYQRRATGTTPFGKSSFQRPTQVSCPNASLVNHQPSLMAVAVESRVKTAWRKTSSSLRSSSWLDEDDESPLYGPAVSPFANYNPLGPIPTSSSFVRRYADNSTLEHASTIGGAQFHGAKLRRKILDALCPGPLCNAAIVTNMVYFPPGSSREWHTNRFDHIAQSAGSSEEKEFFGNLTYRAYIIFTTTPGQSWFTTFKNNSFDVWPDSYDTRDSATKLGATLRFFKLDRVETMSADHDTIEARESSMFHCIASATHRYSLGLAFNASAAAKLRTSIQKNKS